MVMFNSYVSHYQRVRGLPADDQGLKFHHLVAEADRSKLREFLKPLGQVQVVGPKMGI